MPGAMRADLNFMTSVYQITLIFILFFIFLTL